MKKNNIILFLLMALPTLLMTSCLKDQEDLFDDSASARTTKYLANIKQVLTSAENGWLFNYYPDRDQSYGGQPYVVKFKDDTVIAYADTQDRSYSEESYYTLKNEDGPVLMFDTYNSLLHMYSTPTGSSSAGGYEAYDGDFIFIVMGVSEDKNTITLKGNRTGNIMYMYRMTGSAEEYLTQVIEVEDNMPTNYSFEAGGETVKVALSSGTATFSTDTKEVKQAYIYTNEGIEFYEPVEINGQTLNGIKFGGEADVTSSIGDNPILLKVVFLPINEIFVNNDWYLSYANLSDGMKLYFDQAIAGSKAEGETIGTMAFTIVNGFSLYFTSGGYAGALAFDVEFIGENKVKLTYNEANNYSNGTWYYNNANYNYVTYILSTTFTLTANSKIRPTIISLVDDNNPDNVFYVTAAAAAF
ncbi:MAG: DUF4302 domain-containing protein [Prevotella sp.]|nr:DUF4302 domain-containing protein [Prevotella sp.]